MRISLIGTVHEEKGQATVAALLAILEYVRPEVIFLECPPDSFATYFDRQYHRLEADTVSRYRATREIALVPVDAPTPPRSFFNNHEYLFGRLSKHSADFRHVHDSDVAAVAAGGFHYLNSERAIQAHAAIAVETEASLAHIGNPSDLRQIQEAWLRELALRDATMMANIVDYCSRNVFARGAFLVGTAHRESLIAKTRAMPDPGSPKIEWDFAEFLQGLP